MNNSTANKLRQVPAGYLVVGIDPHKKTHAAIVTTQDFTTHNKFKFCNSKEGFEMAVDTHGQSPWHFYSSSFA